MACLGSVDRDHAWFILEQIPNDVGAETPQQPKTGWCEVRVTKQGSGCAVPAWRGGVLYRSAVWFLFHLKCNPEQQIAGLAPMGHLDLI